MNRHIKNRIFISAMILIAIISFSCKSNYNARMRVAEEKFYIQNNSLEAARGVIPNINSGGTDELLFMMEAGLMLHAGEEYEKSTDVLLKAAKIMDNMPIVVRQQATSLLLNDTYTNYRGEDFERVLIHMYLGMNYLFLKKPDEAQVEFRKVVNELQRIKSETGVDYKQNIMAKYLTGIAFEIAAELSTDEKDRYADYGFAIVEYRQINNLNPGLGFIKDDIQRVTTLMEESKKNKSMGQIVMIYQAGRSPYKVSRGKLLSDKKMQNLLTSEIDMAMSLNQAELGLTAAALTASLNRAENPYPKFDRRSNLIKKLRIKTSKKTFDTIVLENIADTSIKNLDDNYDFYRQKIAAGIATKVVASIVATYAAKQASKIAGQLLQSMGGNFAKVGDVMSSGNELIGAAAGVGTAAALISQIKPDLRCWHSLPANFQIARAFLPAGEYEIQIEFIDNNNKVRSVEKEKIIVKQGNTTLLNYRTLY